jgi:epoxide hydrolase-like protein
MTDNTAIRPFQVNVPEAELTDLRRRINATKWPERETVTDASQGVQLATIQALAHYWATDYDWRKVEARLKAYPQFITEIDGLDIHFIHVRVVSRNVWKSRQHFSGSRDQRGQQIRSCLPCAPNARAQRPRFLPELSVSAHWPAVAPKIRPSLVTGSQAPCPSP